MIRQNVHPGQFQFKTYREIFGYLELLGVLGAAAWWFLEPHAGIWPLLYCLAFWAAGILGKAFHWWDYPISSPFDIPLLIFLLTAGIAAWVTFPNAARFNNFPIPVGSDKFWLIAGSVLIFYTLARLPNLRSIHAATALFGLLSVLISLYFLLSNDFTNQTEKFQLIYRIGLLVQKTRPHIGLPVPQPNWAGGLSAVFLPGILEGGRAANRAFSGWKRIVLVLASLAMLGISALGILLSSSRGAWIALFIGLSAWAGITLFDRAMSRFGMDVKIRDRWLGVSLLVCAAAALLVILLFGSRILSLFPPLVQNSSYFPRPELQRNALLLVNDYPFTGSGLGTFPTVFSVYTLLIYVPAIVDAHSLLLDLAISQGIPALFVWLVVLIGTVLLAWQTRTHRSQGAGLPLGAACVILAVMLVHGIVEDPYYDSRAVVLLLAPAGLILAQWRLVKPEKQRYSQKLSLAVDGAVLVGGVILLAGMIILPSWRAAFLANLGAVAQTRVELSRYDTNHFDNPTLDTIRRQADLSLAQDYFDLALKEDPHQSIALQRLAEIALSRKEYDQALAWMQQAAASDPTNRVTRLLLADALVANGKPGQAVALVDGMPFVKGRLAGQGWYRYHLDGDVTREAWANQADQAIK